MKQLLYNRYILLFSRFIIAFVFIFAALEKISDPAAFSEAIVNYRIFPYYSVSMIALVVPWIELISGILLLFGISTLENSYILGSMLLFFIIIIAISMIRGLNIDCGCFGTHHAQAAGLSKILENSIMLLLTLHIIFFGEHKVKIHII